MQETTTTNVNKTTTTTTTAGVSKRIPSPSDNEKSFLISIIILIMIYSFLLSPNSSFVRSEDSVIENYIDYLYNNFTFRPSIRSWQEAKTVYDFEVVDIDGYKVSMSKYR